ncbi:MAG: hypothetical protein QM783_13025 [Phycisphaerales bacterium]
MKNVRTALSLVALIAMAGLAACANNDTQTAAADTKMEAKATNKTCPYTGGAAKADITSTCDGKTVAFCCAGCKGKFDKADHAKQVEMLAKAK